MRGMRLVSFILTRLLQAIPVVLGVVVLNFLLLQLAPGDAATVLAGEAGGAPPEYVEQLRARFGLDKPVIVQLGLYLKNILLLDLGFSFRNNAPVLGLILDRLWPTLLLMGATLVVSVGGAWCSCHRGARCPDMARSPDLHHGGHCLCHAASSGSG